MGKLIEEMSGKGVLESTEGCLSSAKGGHVRLAGGGFSVTDGPFTEAKEIVGGFAIIRANSKEEALGHIKQFLNVAGDGVVEFRQLYEAGDFGG